MSTPECITAIAQPLTEMGEAAARLILSRIAGGTAPRENVNLRPALSENLPVLKHSAGLTCINGLYRHGWLLAPALVEQALKELSL